MEQKSAEGYKYTDKWTDIVSLCSVLDGTLGIRRDGTLAMPATPYGDFFDYSVWTSPPETWTRLARLYYGHQDDLFAVTTDGRVQAATVDEGFRLAYAVSGWREIEKLYPMYERVIGIKTDGTVVYAGEPTRCELNALNSWENILLHHALFHVRKRTEGAQRIRL